MILRIGEEFFGEVYTRMDVYVCTPFARWGLREDGRGDPAPTEGLNQD